LRRQRKIAENSSIQLITARDTFSGSVLLAQLVYP